MDTAFTIALAGNPNAGKTTLFNHLTGSRQHVSNYPGITVEQKMGYLLHNGQGLRIVDLPGTYSLTAYSIEELVARDFLINDKPDVVIDLVDASNLERNLYLSTQFLELGVPMVIALNMVDVAEKRGISINAHELEARLGVPVVPIVARSGKGVDQLLDTVLATIKAGEKPTPVHLRYGSDIDEALNRMTDDIESCTTLTAIYPPRWLGVKLLENDEQIVQKMAATYPEAAQRLKKECEEVAKHLQDTLGVYPETVIADHRYGYIKSIIHHGIVTRQFIADRLYASDKIDKVVTHRIVGPLIMAAVLFGLYTFTFNYSTAFVDLLDGFFGLVSGGVDALLPDGPLKSMMISGVIDGVGSVFSFVPILMFMFFGIAILEDSGYLARVAFMMDRIFHFFGLHGSSVMPFIVSGGIAGGCAVPGVMATRTLRSPKERLATLLTVSFMNCGAKLPVLTLLIGTFFADHKALYMFLATIATWVVALCAAKFLRMTILKGSSTPFVMELPPYRFPTFRGVLIHTWERTWQYMKKAGTVILGVSILLWAMMTYPGLPQEREAHFAHLRTQAETTFNTADKAALQQALQKIDADEASEGLRNSIAGRTGLALENISRYAGIDWRTNIALLGGFAAKEVIVSTMGTAYSLGEVDPEEATSLSKRLAKDPNWNPVVALTVLVFIMFYAPCFVTVVCIAREAGSWKWAFFSMAFNTLLAFIMAVTVYHIGSALYLS
ncbi:MAG: ferrous iron transport protein B [Desulfobulbus oligotrophicus]|jgi:ferrous iron transport protein B|nr:ferrous iron transport protein B [Desulfobulbus oligotrophicus]